MSNAISITWPVNGPWTTGGSAASNMVTTDTTQTITANKEFSGNMVLGTNGGTNTLTVYATPTFQNGLTVGSGTLTCQAISCSSATNTGNLTIEGNTTIGNASTDTLTVNSTNALFNNGIDVRTQTTGTLIGKFSKGGATRFSIYDEGGVSEITSAVIQNPTGNGMALQASHASGTIDLYQQTTKRLSVTSTGVTVTGTLSCEAITCTSETNSGNLTIQGNTTIGDAGTDTLTVNAATTFVKNITLPSSLTTPTSTQLGYIASGTMTASGVSITSNTNYDAGSISLSPGVYILTGTIAIYPSTGGTIARAMFQWSTVSAATQMNGVNNYINVVIGTGINMYLASGVYATTVTTTTTYYLVANLAFSTGTFTTTGGGRIQAIRIA